MSSINTHLPEYPLNNVKGFNKKAWKPRNGFSWSNHRFRRTRLGIGKLPWRNGLCTALVEHTAHVNYPRRDPSIGPNFDKTPDNTHF